MRSSFSLSASQNEKRSTSKIMGLLRKKCGMPLHFIVEFHSLSTSKMLVSRVGSVVRIETSRFFFVIRSVLHRCQAAQRKNGPFVTLTWATDCSNASFSRFRLLTLANPHGFFSIGFPLGVPWMSPPPRPQYSPEANIAKITGLLSNTIMVVHRCRCIFVFFFAKKKQGVLQ